MKKILLGATLVLAALQAGAQAWPNKTAPATTPSAVLNRLTAEVNRIIRSPEVRERLVSQGAEVYTMSQPDFKTFF